MHIQDNNSRPPGSRPPGSFSRPPGSSSSRPSSPRPSSPGGARPPFTPRPPSSGGSSGGFRPGGGNFTPRPPGTGSPGGFSGPRPPFNRAPPEERVEQNRSPDENRINEQIRVPRVRLIDDAGEMLGVMTQREALDKAREVGLDLVEISPGADPPVCKILDYGKFRYQQQKKKAEARKKQKIVEIKELKLRPTIEQHDLEVKLRAAMRFLDEGDKVKFTLRFRGREMAHKELGMKILDRVKEALADKIKIEQDPKFEGNQVIMVVTAAAAKAVDEKK